MNPETAASAEQSANGQANVRDQWNPPERPDWVLHINDEGESMEIDEVVPLDENSLLESAMRSTGLSDFGDDGWREPFQIFVKALNEEAQLNLMGRIRTRSEILQLLEAQGLEDPWSRAQRSRLSALLFT